MAGGRAWSIAMPMGPVGEGRVGWRGLSMEKKSRPVATAQLAF